MPLLTGRHRQAHANILRQVAQLADSGQLRPLLNDQHFTAATIAEAHQQVESGSLGKVVVALIPD